MRACLVVFLLSSALIGCATAPTPRADAWPGLVKVRSANSADLTMLLLKSALERAGMKQFGVVNHAAGAESVGLSLPPTQVILFGNPKAGTPLMKCAATVAIDLPMKALIYEDAQGSVWLAYNDPAYLKARHGMTECDAVLDRVSGALANFAAVATKPTDAKP